MAEFLHIVAPTEDPDLTARFQRNLPDQRLLPDAPMEGFHPTAVPTEDKVQTARSQHNHPDQQLRSARTEVSHPIVVQMVDKGQIALFRHSHHDQLPLPDVRMEEYLRIVVLTEVKVQIV